MPRHARIVVPGFPHHITHRGNRGANIFVRPEDREKYKEYLEKCSAQCGLEIWAYCLMTNHIHLMAVPHELESLARTIGRTHGRFAQSQNDEYGWTGHLWANRYFSTPLDEEHTWAAVRYIELNPVRAGLAERAEDYPWSSARSHASDVRDRLLSASRPFPGPIEGWSEWLAAGHCSETEALLRRNTRSGAPTGSDRFKKKLERLLDRPLVPRKKKIERG